MNADNTNNNNKLNNDSLTEMDFEDKLQAATIGLPYRIDKSEDELLAGHYPDLNQKELIVCNMVISTLWDLGDTYHDAVISYAFENHKKAFSDVKEVEQTIKNLIEKGVLKIKIHFLHARPPPEVPYCKPTISNPVICQKRVLQPRKFLDFTNADIQEPWLLFDIICVKKSFYIQ
jgi:hypothetical protein